ncbi:MAG: RdgB/HAM1 family non-canonical purine NTP pyrophosphatase [Firmicutes bacterium]|nr:RdgB/HAM1 family non-canonical purine NTP pyrophosphatase [Bacillota bacterium]
MKALVVATRNRGKTAEIGAILRAQGIEADLRALWDYPGAPEISEDGGTFVANAVKKARAAAMFTGEVAVADDSGLVVDALGGQPGVMSARFGGPGLTDRERYERLLALMRDVPGPARTARFICAVAVATPEGLIGVAEGSCEGTIAWEPAGEGGFGYDPVFIFAGSGKTFGQLDEATKNRVSHRARAFEKAIPLIREGLGL